MTAADVSMDADKDFLNRKDPAVARGEGGIALADVAIKAYGKKLPCCRRADGSRDGLGIQTWDDQTCSCAEVWRGLLSIQRMHPCTALSVLSTALRLCLASQEVGRSYGWRLHSMALLSLACDWDSCSLSRQQLVDWLTLFNLPGQASCLKSITAMCICELGSESFPV